MKYNLYSTLGIKPKASPEEIKKAYRKIAMENHPDKNPNNKAATKKMMDANEAYEVLSNSAKKKAYDDALMQHLKEEIEREKAKQERGQRNETKTASKTNDKESLEEYLKNAGKSVLAGVLRFVLRR